MLGSATAAHAKPAAPAASATFTTSVQGEPLPVSTWTGSWQVTQAGRAATFRASGVAVTGTETTVHTTWLSAMHRSRGLKFECGGDFITAAPGASNNGMTMRIQFRTRHSRWQEFGSAGIGYISQPLSSGGQGVGSLLEFLHPVTLQWRVTVTATYNDTSQQTFREAVRAV